MRSVRLLQFALTGLLASFATESQAQVPSAFVPGMGTQLEQVGDDFEAEDWKYIPNNPKSSEDIDEQQRLPVGKSANGRWYEGQKRGHPDIVKRVPTPDGGIPGSQGSMLLQSLQTGVPNRPSRTMHQDDFIGNVQNRVGGTIRASQSPSVTTRVYLPPIEDWEPRSGPHFAFRIAIETTIPDPKSNFLTGKMDKNEIYWPGFFIVLESKKQTGKPDDYAYLRIRSDKNGADFRGPQIEVTGWWTLGLSVSADGMVHYYGHPGIEELTREDYITSQYPYGYRCERFRNFFYNVINGDNGQTWSTPWIVDDPKVYVLQGNRTASSPSNRTRR